jgi:hypothetical protein
MANSEIYLKDDSLNSWSPLSFSYISSELNNINASISGLNNINASISGLNQKLNDNISGVNANISGLNQKLNDNISGVNSAATTKTLSTGGTFIGTAAILYGVQASVTGSASIGKTININNGSTETIKFTVPDTGAANFEFTPSVGMNFDSSIKLTTTVGSNQGLSVCAVYKD